VGHEFGFNEGREFLAATGAADTVAVAIGTRLCVGGVRSRWRLVLGMPTTIMLGENSVCR